VGACEAGGKLHLLGGQRLDRKGGEDHVFDAETGIDGIELLFEESCEVVWIAARASSAKPDPFDPAIDAVKAEIEPPRPRPFLRQTTYEIRSEPLRR
jgi:hypothetical protein